MSVKVGEPSGILLYMSETSLRSFGDVIVISQENERFFINR
jgi:hypothetical protein